MVAVLTHADSVRRWVSLPAVHIIAIAAMVAAVYWEDLGGYFLADDLGEVAYVSRIAAGDLGLFWSNFTGNYLQVPVIQVYRPWLMITLVLDFFLWGSRPAGYYADNLLHFFGCCVFLYLLTKELTAGWGPARSATTALLSALIFAAHPLHAESVSWIVGRVDVVCLMYYLLSLFLLTKYLASGRSPWLWGAVAAFVPAILTKEMAVGLPVVAAMIALLWDGDRIGGAVGLEKYGESPGGPTAALKTRLLISRAQTAFKVSVPLFAVLLVYFLARYLALGAVLGGYQGSLGASQFHGLLARWLDAGTLERLLLPMNPYVFPPDSIYRPVLLWILGIAVLWTAASVILESRPWRWITLLGVWIVTSLLPVAHLWGLGPNLDGSRFVFFLTAPMSAALPVLLLAPRRGTRHVDEREGDGSRPDAGLPGLSSVAALLMLCAVLALIAHRNNVPWVQAGEEVRSLRERATALARTAEDDDKLALVGIPKRRGGAHMIYNGDTFEALLSPPFSRRSHDDRFLTFDHPLFGSFDWVNSHHFKAALRNPRVSGFYRWEPEKRAFVRFDPGDFGAAPPPLETVIHQPPGRNSSNGSGVKGADLVLAGVNAFPADFDFLEVATTRDISDAGIEQTARISWKSVGGKSKGFVLPASVHRREYGTLLRFRLSDHWQWYGLGKIQSIDVMLPGFGIDDVRAVSLLSSAGLAPTVSSPGLFLNDKGEYPLRRRNFTVNVDCTRVPRAARVELDVFKPNYFVDQYGADIPASAVWQRRTEGRIQAPVRVGLQAAGGHGYVQARARCLDDQGLRLGEYSDILTFDLQ